MINIKDLTFTYPKNTETALSIKELHVKKGEFIVLCGPSGCGKTTLLRLLKPSMAPHGAVNGLLNVSIQNDAADIGFVQQSPENQIVTDKVWHELAFGMESLGYEQAAIRRRVAEMAEFFGIESWFYKNVSELSGGQKQLLNLAAVMTLDPKLLLLDEPTSQLDPVAAGEFLNMLGRINRELGITVVLSEHRLEEALPHADRCVILDNGSVVFAGSPASVDKEHMFSAMPAAMRIWAGLVEDDGESGCCPVTVKDGRDWLKKYALNHAAKKSLPFAEYVSGETVISADEVYFSYEKGLPDVLKDFGINVKRGELVALLGGNGTGKTTSLKILAGLYSPDRGIVRNSCKTVYLPQDPTTLFTKKTVREELMESADDKAEFEKAAYDFGFEQYLDRHPYDLSGGEQQRLAIAKCFLKKPEVLLLDEPTKGLDASFKKKLAGILFDFIENRGTVIMISHDTDFCALYASRCLMFFDGQVISEGEPRSFFSKNSFYTTSASRIARGIVPDAVTADDILYAFGKKEKEREFPKQRENAAECSDPAVGKEKLTPVRKTAAILSGAAALIISIIIFAGTNLSDFITGDGITDLTVRYLPMYGALILSFIVLMTALSCGKKKPDHKIERRKKLSKRTRISVLIVLALVPATLIAGWMIFGGRQYYAVALLLVLECSVPFVMVFEGRKPEPRELVLIAVASAIAIAGRAVFFAMPGFTPVMGLVILAGAAFGGESGFIVGAVTMLLSNFIFGQGPWTPWQMFSMGLIGFLGGIIPKRNRLSMSVFGAVSAVLIYGGIMNPASALMWDRTGSIQSLIVYYVAGLPIDLVHAAATFITLWFFTEPFLEKTDRIKEKYGILD